MKSALQILVLLITVCLCFVFIPKAYADPVMIKYFHQKGCHNCETTDPIINKIKAQYKNNVIITRIETSAVDGFNQWNEYNFLEIPAIVISNETKIPNEEITEENLRASINKHLEKEKSDSKNTTENTYGDKQDAGYINSSLNLPFAYSLGFFAGFSPCLMAILVFLLSFTAGTSRSIKIGMVRAMIFGLGLMSSYIVLGLFLLSFRKSIPILKAFLILQA